MRNKLLLSLLVLFITLPLLAFKSIESIQPIVISQVKLIDDPLLTAREPEYNNEAIEVDIDSTASMKDNTDIQNDEEGLARELEYNNEVIEVDIDSTAANYIVQVGAYKILDNANIMIEKLKSNYMDAYIDKIDDLNKVRIRGIKTIKEGNRIINDISNKFKIKPFLIKAQ